MTYTLIMKNYEWDENKRRYNLEKHGIDFIDVIEIFDDPNRIEFESKEMERKDFKQ